MLSVGGEIGRFQILEIIGAGGMGQVYRAHDERLERDVAIKVLASSLLTNESARKHFRREALALARLNHPNIETIFEFDSESGLDFLVTEFIPGTTLDDRLSEGPLEEKEIARIGGQLADGVAEAHEQGIIHRDLKPGNLRLTRDGRLKLLDFGLARLVQTETAVNLTTSLSQTQDMRGTLPYMAPEQLLGQKVDARSDIWGMGTVLYEMATACRPFPETEAGELMVAILQLPPALPHSINPKISERLERVILKALSKRPGDRYQSARELGADLAGATEAPPEAKAPVASSKVSKSAQAPSSTKLEIAHVLFMDIVAYSQMPIDEQGAVLHTLQEIVRGTEEFARASQDQELIRLPTGDGMALVFFQDAEAPVRCAVQIAQGLRAEPKLKLRLGIHTGPVYRVEDINANLNVAGGGINLAQRVMDCGDGGHILVSNAVAEVLEQISNWNTKLHDLGEAEVKHGVRVHIFSLYSDEVGNPQLPQKLRLAQQAAKNIVVHRKRQKLSYVAGAVALIGLIGAFGWLEHARAHRLTEKDTLVLSDFTNSTGDKVFDGTLKQGLAADLRQSPFLNILSEEKIGQHLRYMGQPPNAPLTPAIARDLCQRAGSKAYIAGSIGSLGSEYVLGLKAINCQNGDTLTEEQVTAPSKEKVLDKLGEAASRLRGELGESLASVQKFDVPLEEATTSSLEALKAYTLGDKAADEKGPAAALPYHQRAVQLDPNFAFAYRILAGDYNALGESTRAIENYSKAFQLRDHASEWEKQSIAAAYYRNVTGELDKAAQNYQSEVDNYPRSSAGYGNLGLISAQEGQYEKAVELTNKAKQLAPEVPQWYSNLSGYNLALQHLDETKQILREAQARQFGGSWVHDTLYDLAFFSGDSAAMAEQLKWFQENSDYENEGFYLAAETEAYSGHLRQARELTKKAVESAVRIDDKETGAIDLASAALQQAAYGNSAEARQTAEAALKMTPGSPGASAIGALAFAMAEDPLRAEGLAHDLTTRFPHNTQIQALWLPAIEAQISLDWKDPSGALTALQAASKIELGQVIYGSNNSCLYPVYVR